MQFLLLLYLSMCHQIEPFDTSQLNDVSAIFVLQQTTMQQQAGHPPPQPNQQVTQPVPQQSIHPPQQMMQPPHQPSQPQVIVVQSRSSGPSYKDDYAAKTSKALGIIQVFTVCKQRRNSHITSRVKPADMCTPAWFAFFKSHDTPRCAV